MRLRNTHGIVGAVALALSVGLPGCSAQVEGGSPEAPPWPGAEWPTSTPEAQGIDPAAVSSLIADIEAGTYGLIDHFLLIRHGRVVADRHFEQDYEAIAARYDTTNHQYNYDHPAWHPYYRDTDLHTLQSVTKSVTSAALGIAVDEGRIPGVDVPVMPYFSDYGPDMSDPRRGSITLEDFLTMRSGIEWNTTAPYGQGIHSTDHLESSDAWIQFVIDQPMDTVPGEMFEYNDGVSVLIGKLIREATGRRADEWAAEKLFRPIGIERFYWKITPDGEADTEGGLYLATHDLARIGYLFLRGGVWEGERILSEHWVRASVTPIVPDVAPENGRPDPGYGYQWWIPDQEDGQATVYAANGYGGQFLLVVPELDIVAVFNGWNIHEQPERSAWRALQERILPAVDAPTR